MAITLYPVPDELAAKVPGQAVGFVGGRGLSDLGGSKGPTGDVLSYVGRRPHVAGQPVEHADIAEDLLAEIERCAKRIWGPDFVGPMALASGLNLRSVQRGRILSNGLPPPLLDMLGKAAATRSPRATGYALLSVAYVWDEHQTDDGAADLAPVAGPTSNEGRALLAARVREIADTALGLVDVMQTARAQAKAKAQNTDTDS